MNIQHTPDGIFLTDKVLSELDIFVLDFLNILKTYTDYVIVSGYVTILFGRARGTEDIDIIMLKKFLEEFNIVNVTGYGIEI
jgi:hypothetical protein